MKKLLLATFLILFSLTFSLSGFSNENTNFWKETDKLLQELADAESVLHTIEKYKL